MSIISVCLLFISSIDASDTSVKTPLRKVRSSSVNDLIKREQQTLEALRTGAAEATTNNPRRLKERAQSQLPQMTDQVQSPQQIKSPQNSPKIAAQIIAVAASEI
jgi:hypothetical protein